MKECGVFGILQVNRMRLKTKIRLRLSKFWLMSEKEANRKLYICG